MITMPKNIQLKVLEASLGQLYKELHELIDMRSALSLKEGNNSKLNEDAVQLNDEISAQTEVINQVSAICEKLTEELSREEV